MATRIILLSDGTGNAASKVWRTNVWRVFESIDLTGPDQVAFYDDGVGTSSFLPLAILGGAFGWGLKRNIIDLYKFVCRNYSSNQDEIFAFGFSRGAFTIRMVIGLISNQGLVPYQTEAELHANAKAAYRAFRRENFHSVLRVEEAFRFVRDLFVRGRYDKEKNRRVSSVRFLGLWDTVAAYGFPIDEMTRGVSQWLWPLELPERALCKEVKRACHALSLDDERTTFHPVLWTERNETPAPSDTNGERHTRDERISQVWFAGMHSGVGGGYPDDSLAHIPLCWIMNEAKECGLKYKTNPPADPDAMAEMMAARDKDGRMYDSRQGLGGYYRYGPRKIYDLCHASFSRARGDDVEIALPKIHESALKRMRQEAHPYSPIGIPAKYEVVAEDRKILSPRQNPFETPQDAEARAHAQERVWNIVWFRRAVYFATLAASFHLAAFWLFHDTRAQREFESPVRMVSEFIRLVESFLPRQVVRWWTDPFATNPVSFLLGIIGLAILIWIGSLLGSKISNSMRSIWLSRVDARASSSSQFHNWIFRLRTSRPYQAVLRVAKRDVLPFASAVFLLWLGAGVASHVLFNTADSFGLFCHESKSPLTELRAAEDSTTLTVPFSTSAFCFPTGVRLERGASYSVTITEGDDPWSDGSSFFSHRTHPSGYRIGELSDWWMKVPNYASMPFRRVLFRRWLTVIARVGSEGVFEDFLDPRHISGKIYRGNTGRIERSGELFLYVNDAVIGLPWLNDLFYGNNRGTAHIIVRRL